MEGRNYPLSVKSCSLDWELWTSINLCWPLKSRTIRSRKNICRDLCDGLGNLVNKRRRGLHFCLLREEGIGVGVDFYCHRGDSVYSDYVLMYCWNTHALYMRRRSLHMTHQYPPSQGWFRNPCCNSFLMRGCLTYSHAPLCLGYSHCLLPLLIFVI